MQPPPPPPSSFPNRFPTPQPPRKPDLAQRFEALPERTKRFIIFGTIIGVILLATAGSAIDSAIHPQVTAQLTPTITTQAEPTPTPEPTQADPTPTPEPTQTSAQPTMAVQPTQSPPTPTPIPVYVGVNGNPWGYDFTPGSLIYSPPADFCGKYFSCVSSFWTSTNGYVVECANQLYSHSGGVRGACSRDGGVAAILYQH